MIQTQQGNIYRTVKSATRDAQPVTIQVYQFTRRAPYPDTCRARIIFNVKPGTYTAIWYDGEAQNLPALVRSFAGLVEVWIPDGATADILNVPGMAALLHLPG